MRKAEELIAELGFGASIRRLPMKVAIFLFQRASLEDDDVLQDRWAIWLANAAYGGSNLEVRRAYVEILAQIDPLEVQMVDKIYALPSERIRHAGIVTSSLTDQVEVATQEIREGPEPSDALCAALANRKRLGCVALDTSWGDGNISSRQPDSPR